MAVKNQTFSHIAVC